MIGFSQEGQKDQDSVLRGEIMKIEQGDQEIRSFFGFGSRQNGGAILASSVPPKICPPDLLILLLHPLVSRVFVPTEKSFLSFSIFLWSSGCFRSRKTLFSAFSAFSAVKS